MKSAPMLKVTVAASLLALMVAACGGADPTATPRPAAQPQSTATIAATAAATAQPTATGAPATPRPTATQPPVPTAQPTATSAPAPAGDMRIAIATMEFLLFPEQTFHRLWQDPMYDSIVAAGPDGRLDASSSVATSWQGNADFTAWTLKLRNDVVFHDGVRATSADIKWSIEYHTRPESVESGAAPVRSNLAGIDTPDDTTVVFRFKKPDFLFVETVLSPLGSGAMQYLQPKAYTEKVGPAQFNKAGIGSGPFKFKEVVLENKVGYEAVASHWLYKAPRYKTVEFQMVPEDAARVTLLKTGKVEIIGLDRAGGAAIKKDGFTVFSKEGSGTDHIWIHEQYKKDYNGVPNPLADVRVREALNVAVDRQALVDTFMKGLAKVSNNFPLVSWDPAYKPMPIPKFDIARARQLIKDAGYPNGFDLDMAIFPYPGLPEGPEVMEAIATWWEQAGVRVTRRTMSFNAVRDTWYGQKFDRPTASGVLLVANRLVTTGSAQGALKPSAQRVTEDAELGTIAAQWAAATNLQDYTRYAQQFQEKVTEKFLFVSLFESGDTYAASPRVGSVWRMGKGVNTLRVNEIATGRAQ